MDQEQTPCTSAPSSSPAVANGAEAPVGCPTACSSSAQATEPSGGGRRHVTYMCNGDSCVPLKSKCNSGACPPVEELPPSFCVAPFESQQWQEFSPEAKKLCGQGRVWVLVGPPCKTKMVLEPFASVMEQLKSTGGNLSRERRSEHGGEEAARPKPSSPTLSTAAWAYPRIKFVSEAHIALCERATSIFGRAPFIGLVDMPNSAAYVLELLQPAPCTLSHRTVNAFKPVSAAVISEFVLDAVSGRWPRAPLGEEPPADDIDLSMSDLKCTLKAVLATLPRLARGDILTVCEAKRLERISDQMNEHHAVHRDGQESASTHDPYHAGPAGKGPLLVLLTLWAPRCPCCPALIRLLDYMMETLLSRDFRAQFPNCPIFELDATIRSVTLDIEKNEIDDSEWPGAHEDLAPLTSPALGAARSPDVGQPRSLSLNDPASGFPKVPVVVEPSAELGGLVAERTIPTIIAYRDGKRMAKFAGIRTPKNLVSFITRAFGLYGTAKDDGIDCAWVLYLQSELERYEAQDDCDSLRKRSRTSDRAL